MSQTPGTDATNDAVLGLENRVLDLRTRVRAGHPESAQDSAAEVARALEEVRRCVARFDTIDLK